MKTPWSYDVFESELNPRHNRGIVYDAESAVMCQVRGADAREITSLIVEAVNGFSPPDGIPLTQSKMEKIYRRLVESGARVQDTDAPMGLMQQNPETGELEPLDPESHDGKLLRKS